MKPLKGDPSNQARWDRMKIARCVECDAELSVPEDILVGEILNCSECGLELEVKKVNSDRVELQELMIEGEDWGE